MLVGNYLIIDFVKHRLYCIQTYFIVPNTLRFNAVINDLYNNAFAHYAPKHPNGQNSLFITNNLFVLLVFKNKI